MEEEDAYLSVVVEGLMVEDLEEQNFSFQLLVSSQRLLEVKEELMMLEVKEELMMLEVREELMMLVMEEASHSLEQMEEESLSLLQSQVVSNVLMKEELKEGQMEGVLSLQLSLKWMERDL